MQVQTQRSGAQDASKLYRLESFVWNSPRARPAFSIEEENAETPVIFNVTRS